MPPESRKAKQARAQKILQRLRTKYPEACTALNYCTPLEMLVATILSAQCTDVKVNEVTQELFKKYRTAPDYAQAAPQELEQMIRPTGFFRNKARSLIGMGQALVAQFGGEVPANMEDLLKLPGVARKTANVVLGNVFEKAEGVVVDTHVKRLSYRMGLTTEEKNTDKIERDLMVLFPPEDWIFIGHALILHGRETCPARKPKCGECIISDLCLKKGVK